MDTNENSSSFIQIFLLIIMTLAAATGWYFYQQSNNLAKQLKSEVNNVKVNLNNKTNQVYELLDKQQIIKNKENNKLKSFESQIAQLQDENNTLKSFESQIAKLKQENNSLKSAESKLAQLTNKIKTIQDKLQMAQEKVNSCDIEKQALSATADEKDTIINEKENLINETNIKLNELQTAYDEVIANNISQKNNELEQCQNKNSELVTQYKQQQSLLELKISQLQKSQTVLNITKSQKQTVNKNKSENANSAHSNNNIAELFKTDLNNYSAQVEAINHNGVLITIPCDYLFHGESYQITNKGADLLTIIANKYKTLPNQDIEVIGHTDNRPAKKHKDNFIVSNWELSAARAAAIIRLFQFRTKIKPQRMKLIGASEFYPLAKGNNESSRKTNRRIELRLVPRNVRAHQ
ncbi:MAG: OmpA family protein [Gammaproteobacteria bacterium]|nr:OmpA family protein [Gammaproteobacteria bacterium]